MRGGDAALCQIFWPLVYLLPVVLSRVGRNKYTYGDSDVISMPAGFRRHLVGKTLRNICYCNTAEIRSVAKLVIIDIFL